MIHLESILEEPGASLVGDAVNGIIRWELRLFRKGVEVFFNFSESEDTKPEVFMRTRIAPFLRTLETRNEGP